MHSFAEGLVEPLSEPTDARPRVLRWVACQYRRPNMNQRETRDEPSEPQGSFEDIFDGAPMGIFQTTIEGRFLRVNATGAAMFGYDSPEEIIRAVSDAGAELYVRPEQRREIVRELLAADGFMRFESEMRRRDGSTFIARLNMRAKRTGDRVVCLEGFVEDITERKEAEQAQRRSEEMLRLVLDTIPSWVFWKDRNSVYMGCNYLFAANAGLDRPEEIAGKTDYDLPWTREEAESYRADDQMVMSTGIPKLNYEETQSTADGRLTWVRTSKVPLRDHDGEVVGILGTFEDITERKQAEEALRESEERYRSIFNSSAEAFLVFDLDGYIIDANPTACQLYGYTCGEMIGRFGRDLVAPDRRHLFDEFKQVESGKWFTAESEDVRSDGSRFDVEVHGTRIYYRGKEQLLAIVHDVTERNRSREALQMYADIVHNMQVGLYVYHLEDPNDDRTLRLTAANPASTAGLGLDEECMIGHYIDEVFPGLRAHDLPRRFARVALSGEPFSIDDMLYGDHRVTPRHFAFRAFAVPGDRVGVLFDDTTEVVHAEEEKRVFYRETISSVTDGKLLIVDRTEAEKQLASAELGSVITSYADTVSTRKLVEDYCRAAGFGGDPLSLFITGVGEAMANAIKHAGEGRVFAGRKDGGVWVGVSDAGSGIAALALPKATLRRGYSTKISMGMGYSIMLDVADKVTLSTGPEGTIVMLSKCLVSPEPILSLENIPDTWDSI